ncbi:hypothetical protein ACQ7HM_17570 [Williamsia sp. MIQD14]|uniref:hypothetical protein n=1 Tax=Williamsia sp. MIQD14 TaxID=3425703 RepID=UPI003DA0EFBD
MISDSVPWKEDLYRVAERLDRRGSQVRWTERTAFLVERDVMFGCFAIRKLLDTPGKISDECRGESMSVLSFPLSDVAPDFWDAYDFADFFGREDEGPTRESIGLRQLCDRVIHSLIFGLEHSEDPPHQFGGVFVASDKSSKTSLTLISLAELVRVFRIVAGDEVVSLHMIRDETGHRKVVRASRVYDG